MELWHWSRVRPQIVSKMVCTIYFCLWGPSSFLTPEYKAVHLHSDYSTSLADDLHNNAGPASLVPDPVPTVDQDCNPVEGAGSSVDSIHFALMVNPNTSR